MKRVVLVTFSQETGSFNPRRSRYDDFNVLRGKEILAAHRGRGSSTGGAIEVLESRPDIELVPAYAAWMGVTGGLVAAADTERLISELLSAVEANAPADGVCLCLHGAMAGEYEPDPEGRVVEGIRRILGKVPTTASMDLHGIITDRLMGGVDAISFLHTYPHVDGKQTGARGARNLLRLLDGKARPTTARVKIPLLARGNELITATGLFGTAIRRCQEIEAAPWGIAAGVNIGNPFTDVPDLRSNTIVTTDGDPERARTEALGLARFMWENRRKWVAELMPMEEIVRRAEGKEGLTVCADPADSTASGAPGDSNWILKGLLDHGYTKRALIPLVDAPAVEKAINAGVGRTIRVALGGSIDRERHTPLEVAAKVHLVSDGETVSESRLPSKSGRTAVLGVGRHAVVVSERPVASTSLTFFQMHGQDPRGYDFVVCKSPNGFRIHFEAIASQILYADVPGSTSADVRTLPYKQCPRPIWPLDPDVEVDFET